jgi:hypothetical protein
VDTFYRLHPPDHDPQELLDPDQQVSEPWDGAIQGKCDKCEGEGTVEMECDSCKAGTPDSNCPHCSGEVTYRDECPTCEGSGEIDDSKREGISVFPEEEGLYRYMLKREVDLEGQQLVVLEGELSKDEDFDADEGALLIKPTRIVESREPDWDCVRRLSGESQQAA